MEATDSYATALHMPSNFITGSLNQVHSQVWHLNTWSKHIYFRLMYWGSSKVKSSEPRLSHLALQHFIHAFELLHVGIPNVAQTNLEAALTCSKNQSSYIDILHILHLTFRDKDPRIIRLIRHPTDRPSAELPAHFFSRSRRRRRRISEIWCGTVVIMLALLFTTSMQRAISPKHVSGEGDAKHVQNVCK